MRGTWATRGEHLMITRKGKEREGKTAGGSGKRTRLPPIWREKGRGLMVVEERKRKEKKESWSEQCQVHMYQGWLARWLPPSPKVKRTLPSTGLCLRLLLRHRPDPHPTAPPHFRDNRERHFLPESFFPALFTSLPIIKLKSAAWSLKWRRDKEKP